MMVSGVIIAALLAVVLFSFFSGFSLRRRGVGTELRELLLARAEGRISAEEYERRQAALHAKVMAQSTLSPQRRLLWALPVVAVVVAGADVYFKPAGPEIKPAMPLAEAPAPVLTPQAKPANSGGDLKVMVKRLAGKLEKDPNNAEGWLLLAHTYGELHQPGEAAAAYAKAAAIAPPGAAVLAEWADARVQANGRKWDDEARDIVKRALAADPKHLKALALAGSEAFDRADYRHAISYWKQMQLAAPAGSMDARLAEMNIAEANGLLAGKPAGDKTSALNGAVLAAAPRF